MILAALTLVAGLTWYTDFDQAKAAAQREGKPILSLRLLGNLDEELSCANSRFFRTILYSDPRIAAELRQNFILHWQSVRPVPKITIDFGDGRKITTTITGNSIHYLLSPDGRVVDALPGMYTPEAFLAALKEFPRAARNDGGAEAGPTSSRTAVAAAELARSKAGGEAPVLNALFRDKVLLPYLKPADEVVISDESLLIIRAKSRPRSDADFASMISLLKSTLAADTLLNETKIRPVIRRWIAQGMTDVDALNDRVYDELFLTPKSDPWLGLLPDAYTGVENDGVTTTPVARAGTTSGRPSGAPARSSRSRR